MPRSAVRDDSTTSIRERVVAAAGRLTVETGWASVTMGRLATDVGVSRQTVYTEVGSKSDLAEALVLTELARFLQVVEAAFDEQPDDLVEAIRAAARGVLELAAESAMLRAVVSATHGADTELLPLLTTNSRSLLARANAVVSERVQPYEPGLTPPQAAAAIDVVIRVVLSHVMQPTGSPGEAADGIAWVAERMLRADR
ncbi:TetR family transcriptional regulator [Luteipulveratus sp. YIM 133132]|uniref:TetR family transcriptional regulator n=1 Tax=Luteipulveratus flavus TaxID=3031728 RepID=UPI0023AF6E77|nr:TetR family transcriptional regulator [Luteipulveratus sp. YIM 133132]MDE9366273.1 TetR family transcriptional regulator [Luteipulveratus sp. YIM 133132]